MSLSIGESGRRNTGRRGGVGRKEDTRGRICRWPLKRLHLITFGASIWSESLMID